MVKHKSYQSKKCIYLCDGESILFMHFYLAT